MHILIFFVLLFALIAGPGMWVKMIMQRYSEPAQRYAYTGAETARRLLKTLGLHEVAVEATEVGDHYDPIAKAVRLSSGNHDGYSLTAITIAAHEVGHAMQDANGYAPLKMRTRLVQWVAPVEKTGAALLMATPLIVALIRVPAAGLLMAFGGLLSLGAGAAVHFLTLPTEYDASFARAMPLLKQEGVLIDGDEKHARKLLKAAALTYVSVALMSLLNIARWWAILRR
jgi:Zn-dependent membrane protease YugP